MSQNVITDNEAPGAFMEEELASQPAMWQRAVELARDPEVALPVPGSRVAVIGCGTSWFMAQSYALLRERSGQGVTDAFAASEALLERGYDAVLAITRSGTTTEILEALDRVRGAVPTVVLVGEEATPAAELADAVIGLPFADERSVVQTRFATTVLAFLRATLGEDLARAIDDGHAAVAAELADDLVAAEQYTFLGRGWTVGVANEAALKVREASQAWTESYPAMEYRHGPISVSAPRRVTWMFGEAPSGLAADVGITGARFETSMLDPMAELVRVHRVALERSRLAGLDPDRPRNLTRSVVLGAS